MSANDKAAATYGPGRTTPAPIAERTVDMIVDFSTEYKKNPLGRQVKWPQAEAALRALLEEVWDAGYAAGDGDRWEKKQGHRAEHDSEANPYRSNDE